MRRNYSTICLLILTSIVTQVHSETKQPLYKECGALGKTLNAMCRDAKIGADEKLASGMPVIPEDLGKLIRNWKGTKRLGVGSKDRDFSIRNKLLWLPLSGSITVPEDDDILREKFDRAMKGLGYTMVTGKEPLLQLSRRLGEGIDFFDKMCNIVPYDKYVRVYLRKVGDTEQVVYSETSNIIGSRSWRGRTTFNWFLIHPYTEPSPKLSEVLETLPAWWKPEHLSDSLCKSLANEQVCGCRLFTTKSPNMVSSAAISFERKGIYDTLSNTLKAEKFDFRKEDSPNKYTGLVSMEWFRYSDRSTAYILVHPETNTCRLDIRGPFHKGPPLPRPKRELPEVSKLPKEKRPVQTLDKLKFTDPKLEATVRRWEEHIEKLSGKSWYIRGYRDTRSSRNPWSPVYDACWQSCKNPWPNVPRGVKPEDRPFRNFYIKLSGNDPGEGGEEKLSSATFYSTWIPTEGIAARIRIWMGHNPENVSNPYLSFSFGIGMAEKKWSFSYRISTEPRNNKIIMRGNEVFASVSGKDKINYDYRASIPWHFVGSKKGRSFIDEAKTVYSSPKSLLDSVLDEYDHLRKKAADEIPKLEGITAYSMHGVRSSRPPLEVPIKDHPPGEKVRTELLEKINAELDRREKYIREHHKAIHASIVKALSLQDIERILGIKLPVDLPCK